MIVTIDYTRACFAGGLGPTKMVIARAIERHSKL